MAGTTLHVDENSPEHIAFKLMEAIADNEDKGIGRSYGGSATADRDWILSTYAQCIRTVKRGTYSPADTSEI
jgi:hypothetical protein